MVDKTLETPQTEVDKMTEKLTHRTMEQENEHFSHWIATETPFDENVGMVERGMKVAAAWQGWIACAASRDFDEMMSREPKTGPRCGAPETPKAARVRAIVDAGPFPGMSEAFDTHMGAACWTDPAYAPDASMWAAAWKASTAARLDLVQERDALRRMVTWAYVKLDSRVCVDMDDALELDRLKLYVEYGVRA